jgi:hypothetical protein
LKLNRTEEGADDDDDDAALPLFGNGGDGEYEKALCQLAAAVHAGDAQGLAASLLDAVASLAAGAGLLRKPRPADDGAGSDAMMSHDAAGEGVAETSQWLQLLQYASLMLRALPARRGGAGGGRGANGWEVRGAAMGLQDVWEALLMPGVRHEDAAVR